MVEDKQGFGLLAIIVINVIIIPLTGVLFLSLFFGIHSGHINVVFGVHEKDVDNDPESNYEVIRGLLFSICNRKNDCTDDGSNLYCA